MAPASSQENNNVGGMMPKQRARRPAISSFLGNAAGQTGLLWCWYSSELRRRNLMPSPLVCTGTGGVRAAGRHTARAKPEQSTPAVPDGAPVKLKRLGLLAHRAGARADEP